ncbi:MAG: hypothetical protein ACO1SX_22455 [Actinomycetota bacterium]
MELAVDERTLVSPAVTPTLLLCVGDKLAGYVEAVISLLATHEERVLPIIRAAAVFDGSLQVVLGDAPPAGQGLARSLAHCLESVVTEAHLQRVREAGLRIGVRGGQLAIRVLLLLDGAQPENVHATLQALREAAALLRQLLPIRLTCVSLAAGKERAELGFRLDQELTSAGSDRLEIVNLIALDRFRSDGSSLGGPDAEAGKEEIRHALSSVLFAALLPSIAEDHWLFLRPSAGSLPCHTVGIGALVVPRMEIETALGHALAADLMRLLAVDPDPAASPERLWGVAAAGELLSEEQVRTNLLLGIPVEPPRGLSGAGEEPFAVHLLDGQMRLDLGEEHWSRWEALVRDYDAKTEAITAERWVQMMRESAVREYERLRKNTHGLFDTAVREGKGALPSLEALVARVKEHLGGEWRCHRPEIKTDIPDPNLTGPRNELCAALQQMPNSWALGVRCALLVLLQVYLSFAVVRSFWTLVAAPLTLLAGALGLVLALGTVWFAIRQWSGARDRVYRARDRYLAAVARKYEGILRAQSILLLREIRSRLLADMELAKSSLTVARTRLSQIATAADAHAREFAPTRSSLIRPVVDSWEHLEPARRDLWGGRDLKPVVVNLLTSLQVTSFAELCSATEARPSEVEVREVEANEPEATPTPRDELADRVFRASREALVRTLMNPATRTLGYYAHLAHGFSTKDAGARWLTNQVQLLHGHAVAVLWSSPYGAPRVWQLLPLEDEHLQQAARSAHPLPQPTPVLAPCLLGTLICQQVDLFRDHS